MGPPLRPHPSEIQVLEHLAADLAGLNPSQPLHVLLLGVTEEIVHLAWPESTMLTAVDRSSHMIQQFWPGDQPGKRQVIQADWFDLPFEPATFDLIIGDGVFNFMTYPEGYQRFAAILAALVKPTGKVSIRLFSQCDPQEHPQAILADYQRRARVNYHAFRLRIATSLQEDVHQGIGVTKESLDRYLVSQGIALNELYK